MTTAARQAALAALTDEDLITIGVVLHLRIAELKRWVSTGDSTPPFWQPRIDEAQCALERIQAIRDAS